MNIAQGLSQQWLQRIASEHPEINAEDRGAIVNWLLGESPERLSDLTEADLAVARQAIEYRHRILQQRYLNVSSKQGYQQLTERLSNLFLIRNKIKAWISLSRVRRRTVVDVMQETVQEMVRSDRHLAQQFQWIARCTQSSRLQSILMLASIEEYCLRPIRSQPLIVYRFVDYLQRNQAGGITQVPSGELIRLISLDFFGGDNEYGLFDSSSEENDAYSLLRSEDIEAFQAREFEDEEASLRQLVKNEFKQYLSNALDDTASTWLELYLNGYSQERIAQELNLSMQQIYRLREKVSYHAVRVFALRQQPRLVFEWLKTSLVEHNFGLTRSQWNTFYDTLTNEQQAVLTYFREERSADEIARILNLKSRQIQSIWAQIYLQSQSLRLYYQEIISEIQDIDKALTPQSLSNEFIEYQVLLDFSSRAVKIGEEVKITLAFQPTSTLNSDNEKAFENHKIRLNACGEDLNIFLSAKNCLLLSNSASSLPSFRLSESSFNASGVTEFDLIPISSGLSKITAEIYEDKKFIIKIEKELEVSGLEDSETSLDFESIKSRPVSRSDVFLNIKESKTSNDYVDFEFRLGNFSGKSPSKPSRFFERLSRKLVDALKSQIEKGVEPFGSHHSSVEKHLGLINVGYALFSKIIPSEIREEILGRGNHRYPFSMLITDFQNTCIPWNILHDGKRFLAESLIIGKWPFELINDCPYEFPVGTIGVSYYESTKNSKIWEENLNPIGSPLPFSLEGGTLANLSQLDSLRGLHIAQTSKLLDNPLEEAPIYLTNLDRFTGDIEAEIRPAKLTLRKNRPLVSLSFLRGDVSELSGIENSWIPAFIRAGASAFVGPLWSVDAAVDAAFFSTFYTRLWMGDALGQAFHTARQMARIAVPESCDWLAYVLYGDPMARPYRPVEGKGYAVVEPIGQDIKDPLPPNQSLRFRLTLRRDPPIWHEDRLIEVAEDLAFDNLQVHMVAFGLEVNPTTVDMSRTPNGNYLGWFTLSAPPAMAGETVPVQVHFADGAEPVHSVTFALQIAAEASE